MPGEQLTWFMLLAYPESSFRVVTPSYFDYIMPRQNERSCHKKGD